MKIYLHTDLLKLARAVTFFLSPVNEASAGGSDLFLYKNQSEESK